MNREDTQEIRDFVIDRLEFLQQGSHPKEKKVMEKILVMTTECLEIK